MTNPRDMRTLALWLGVAALSAVLLGGCGGESPQEPQQSALPERNYTDEPEPAPTPQRLTVRDLNLAEGVEYPTPRIPNDAALARALADFAGALKTGDNAAVRSHLTDEGAAVLSTLVESGAWEATTSGIQAVRVCTMLESGDTASIGLGVLDANGAYLTGWRAVSADGAWSFEGMAVESLTAASLASLDGSALTPLPMPVAGVPLIERAAPAPTDSNDTPAPAQRTGSRPRG